MKIIISLLFVLSFIQFSINVYGQEPATTTGIMSGMYKKLVHFNNLQKEQCTLTIVDSVGTILKTYKDITTDTITLDLRNLNKGKYTYTVKNAAGTELKHGMVMGRHVQSNTEVAPSKNNKK